MSLGIDGVTALAYKAFSVFPFQLWPTRSMSSSCSGLYKQSKEKLVFVVLTNI